MEMIDKVRGLKLRDKLSNSAKKWLKAPGDKLPRYHRESAQSKLTGLHPLP